jgi:hypothetical protein
VLRQLASSSVTRPPDRTYREMALLRPSYAKLLKRRGYPPGSAWGLHGAEDQVGAVNDLSSQNVLPAAGLVKHGQVFPLNWEITKPDPPLFGRGPIVHVVKDSGFAMDDHYDHFFPQGSSQWDALSHYSHPTWGYYNGRSSSDLRGAHPANGIDNWARSGIVGRYLLADVGRWREARDRPIRHEHRDVVHLSELVECLIDQKVEPAPGDILLVRLGWIQWYEGLSPAARVELVEDPAGPEAPGLQPSTELFEWLWDCGAVALASDTPAVEAYPFDYGDPGTIHANVLALLGLPLGELFALDRLADACAADRRYVGFFAAAPLNMPGGIGSPANALAVR